VAALTRLHCPRLLLFTTRATRHDTSTHRLQVCTVSTSAAHKHRRCQQAAPPISVCGTMDLYSADAVQQDNLVVCVCRSTGTWWSQRHRHLRRRYSRYHCRPLAADLLEARAVSALATDTPRQLQMAVQRLPWTPTMRLSDLLSLLPWPAEHCTQILRSPHACFCITRPFQDGRSASGPPPVSAWMTTRGSSADREHWRAAPL
jgi:hypothetical protein